MKYSELTNRQQAYIDAIRTHGPDCGMDTTKEEYSRAELRQVSMKMKGKKWIPNWITHDQARRAGRGVFMIPEVADVAPGQEHEGDREQDAVQVPVMDAGELVGA